MNILITGASSGIGLRTAEKLVAAGHTVYNVSRNACENPHIVNILADLGEPDAMRRAMDSVCKHCGKVDAGIYCAGYAIAGSLSDVTYDDAARLTQVNYLSAVCFASEFARRFKNGKIILLSSMAAYFPMPYQPHYSASKAALLAFARATAQEYKYTGLQICCVTPGGTATNFSAHREKIYGTKENRDLNAAISSVTDMEQTGQLADDVAEKLIDLLNKTKMPVVVRTDWKDSLALFAASMLPRKAEDAIIFSKFGQHKPKLVKAQPHPRAVAKPKIIDLTEDREEKPDAPRDVTRDVPEEVRDYYPPERIEESQSAHLN